MTSTYPSIQVEDTLKITVGCPLCTFPSIHFSLDEDTLKITVGCLTSAHPSVHEKTLKITVGCPLCTYPSSRNKNLHTCGLWARPPVLSPVPVPSQAIHSRTGLNLHYSDIQSTAQKSPCVNTFLRPSLSPPPQKPPKKNSFFLVTRESLAGHTERRHTARRQRHRRTGHM